MIRITHFFRSNLLNQLIVGIIVGIALLILFWTVFHQHSTSSSSSVSSQAYLPLAAPTALHDVGISLYNSAQTPVVTQQQALALAQAQLASSASPGKTQASYVLLSDSNVQPALNYVPVWIIWYQKILFTQSADTIEDTHTSSQTSHDLFVFLNADDGQVLFTLWA